MKKKILSALGAIALMSGMVMSLQYSLNDYGMNTNSLSTFALAQTRTTFSDDSAPSGLFWTLTHTTTVCTYSSNPTSGGISGSLPGGGSAGISGSGGATITYTGEVWECYDGWNPFCEKDCRAPL